MRGIEAALQVLEQVRAGRFASEALRRIGMRPADAALASLLVYIALRRQELWQEVYGGFLKEGAKVRHKGLPPAVQDALLAGTAGLLELRHFAGGVLVNALLDDLKARSLKRWVPLVNAVLHNVGEEGAKRVEALRRSPALEDRALWAGVPRWSLPAWTRTWQRAELNRLFELLPLSPAAALRPAPGRRDELLARLREAGVEAEPSDLSEAVRLKDTLLPTEVPGFDEGLATMQTEGSMLVADRVRRCYRGGLILDMCSGRGVKAGQILSACPEARLEGWELSEGRHRSALREVQRLGVEDRARLRCGDALKLEPEEAPSLILLDAPCSGSGTWSRKPEAKWRLTWEGLDRLAAVQRALLERAFALSAPRGIIIYVTCSLLRGENENVTADFFEAHPECAELPARPEGSPFRRGRPWGTYIWPENPWLDGFYCAAMMRLS